MSGWIKLHRSITENWVFDDPNALKLFVYLLLKASHKDKKTLFNGQLIDVKRGQLIVGREATSKKLGLSVRTYRTLLNKLKIDQLIELEPTNKSTLVTIVKYSLYQDGDQQSDQQKTNKPTSKRPASDQQATTSKECKEDKEGKEVKNGGANRAYPKLDFSQWPSEPSPEVLADWIKVRKSKKAELTQTAINRLTGEIQAAAKQGLSADDCIGACCEFGWVGFKLEWLQNKNNSGKVVNFQQKSAEDIAYDEAMREAGF